METLRRYLINLFANLDTISIPEIQSLTSSTNSKTYRFTFQDGYILNIEISKIGNDLEFDFVNQQVKENSKYLSRKTKIIDILDGDKSVIINYI